LETEEHLRKGISCAKHLHVCEERGHDLLDADMPCLAEGAESFNAPREANREGRQRTEGGMLVIRLERARFLGPLDGLHREGAAR
jgi:hypothetical protein